MIVTIIEGYHCYQLYTQYSSLKVISVFTKLLGIISVDLDVLVADHIFCICQVLEKEWEYNGSVH
jgi:hypothetical protein